MMGRVGGALLTYIGVFGPGLHIKARSAEEGAVAFAIFESQGDTRLTIWKRCCHRPNLPMRAECD